MARRRSGRRGGQGRSKAFKARNFRATCCECNIVSDVPVRPPPGIELMCVDCIAKKKDEAEKADIAAKIASVATPVAT